MAITTPLPPSASHGLPFRSVRPVRSLKASRLTDFIFITGMLTMPFQVVQIGIAQPVHVWVIFALGVMVWTRNFRPTGIEIFTLVAFWAAILFLVVAVNENRLKVAEQLFKFCIIYPGFYFVGRWLGSVYFNRRLPLGYVFLAALLVFEIAVQRLSLPYIYKEDLIFAQNALHGTFKERNWLASYVFLFSYVLFEAAQRNRSFEIRQTGYFILINLVTMVLTASKTAFVAVGIVLLLKSRAHVLLKGFTLVVGAVVYWYLFSDDFSERTLNIRLQNERGLAFQVATDLISNNPFGYGVGFVESYFSNLALPVLGLGAGVNSIFSVPLDLMIIAGPFGLLFWLVFFAGVGLGAKVALLPVACLSLLNPLHQSEIVYFFVGMLISYARRRSRGHTARKARTPSHAGSAAGVD
jgi:hypothetical protein